MSTEPCGDDTFAAYRPWFYAAAVYNLIWGAVNIIAPGLFFDLIDAEEPNYLPIWQVVGMFVLVYAPAYWWAARRPARHRHLIVIGLLGKVLGPIGFVWAVANDDLPGPSAGRSPPTTSSGGRRSASTCVTSSIAAAASRRCFSATEPLVK